MEMMNGLNNMTPKYKIEDYYPNTWCNSVESNWEKMPMVDQPTYNKCKSNNKNE